MNPWHMPSTFAHYTRGRSGYGASILRSTILLLLLVLAAELAFGGIATDVNVSKDGASASTTITSAAFSTSSANEQLLAFIATDYLSGTNTTVKSVTGAGLTWTLIKRTNTQSGSSEIWGAFAASQLINATVSATLSQSVVSSLTVMSFAGVNQTGAIGAVGGNSAASGAPTATLITTGSNSVVVGVGNDFDNAISRTVGSGQILIHQYLTPTGDTYWVQIQASAPASGTKVVINDTAPTQDRFNLSIVEILAATSVSPTYSISGTITPGAGGSGATIALSGSSSATTVADANGNYSFTGLSNGSYTATPSKTGYTFSPPSQSVTVNGANQAGINFSAQAVASWSVSGTISPASSGTGSTVLLSGTSSASTVADANGNYSFTGLANGSYTVTPSKNSYTFSPPSQSVTVNGANQTGINFSAQTIASWSISGTITPAASGSGAAVSLSGTSTASTTADANGNYSFSPLTNGTYTVTPSRSGFTFSPPNQPVTLNGAGATNVNFTAAAVTTSGISRDVTVWQDGASASKTITSPAFSTSSANEQLLAFIATDYLSGTNTTVQSVVGAGLTWSLVKRTNTQSGSSEIWGAFASTTLNSVTVTATLSQSIISSMTIMSFAGVNQTGAIGAVGGNSASSGAPTTSLVTKGSNSLVVGVGNDFDNAISRTVGAGQILIHQDLTSTGDTYWVQMQASTIPTSGTTVVINDTAPAKDRFNLSIVEVLAAGPGVTQTPPTVDMTSPAQGAMVSGRTTVSANASDSVSVTGVQFLLDGEPLGTQFGTPPYSFAWDSTTVADGIHSLSARAVDGTGLSTTSTPVSITVSNSSDPSVVGQWSNPITLPAVAVNLILLQNNKVLFYQDGATPTVWDYVQNTFINVPESADLFCSGHALLSDGRVMVVGGYGESSTTIGIANAEIFDPTSLKWTSVPNMQYRRWYPTATTLSDGRILVTAGWQTSAHTNAGISEIYDPVSNTWTSLTNANNPFETYPFLYLLPDGRVLHIGGSEYATDTDVLDLSSATWTVVDPTIVDGGSATMYVPNKFMKAGSSTDSQGVGASSNTTFVLDMTQPSPAWKQTPSMAYPRSFLNLTMLPDGTILATGGETDKNGGNVANAVYAAELWSPQTQTWSTMASMHTPREYHGTALLLPDGRVLESGMGADFGNVPDEKSAEFYSPPYLFKGARPTITQAPSQIQYNSSFFVSTPDSSSIASVVLIRTGAVTHFFDQNERFLPLAFTQTAGGLNVTAPVDANLAPPGYYMLFIVNNAGVPSVAPFVQLP